MGGKNPKPYPSECFCRPSSCRQRGGWERYARHEGGRIPAAGRGGLLSRLVPCPSLRQSVRRAWLYASPPPSQIPFPTVKRGWG